MTDYILFTSEFIRKEIPKLRSIEVIPIFGKLNYIFFSKLAQKIDIKCRFLLDKDNNLVEGGGKVKSGEIKGTKLKNCKHEPKKCTREQICKNF